MAKEVGPLVASHPVPRGGVLVGHPRHPLDCPFFSALHPPLLLQATAVLMSFKGLPSKTRRLTHYAPNFSSKTRSEKFSDSL